MTERIDHAAEAAQIAAGGLASGSFDQTRDYLALAQVHATLALVEQQRIGNLIALSNSGLGPLMQAGDLALLASVPHSEWPNTNIEVLRPEIRQALGLND
ncbi:hypothetical protein Pan2_54 [Pseudanabaena phage Pan2]|nr:hypothetical protein Pan2_54 [Pseudanabaena phage Pan2]